MTAVTLTVLGTPAPQGSKTGFVRNGRAVMVESSKRVRPWRQAVIDQVGADGAALELRQPVELKLWFYFRRPASHYGTGRNRERLKPSAPAVPAGTPDLSKLIRATEDALTDARVWKDDALVVSVQACKLYADGGRHPGAVITVTELVSANARATATETEVNA